MTAAKAYERLIQRYKKISLLTSCSSVLRWDERTYMPKGAARLRSEQLALLTGLAHEQYVAPELGELLAQIEGTALLSDPLSVPAVNVREIRRLYERRQRLPQRLVQELARVTSLAQAVWAEARAASDFSLFRPHLEEILTLVREEAQALAADGGPLYDALLDEFEPGQTSANLTALFTALRDGLVPLIRAVAESARHPDTTILQGHFPIDRQEAFGRDVSRAMGFDFYRGRLDVTVHPFCVGIGPGDTRMTTRYDPASFTQAFFAILHETGHGLYNQGLDDNHTGTPMGQPVSLSIHESQSRLWENFVGRSRPFWEHVLPGAKEAFPEALGSVSVDALYGAVNELQPRFIRVDADEASYNMHILLRFEIEQALLAGDLSARDLPGAWNEAFQCYFGMTPPDDARGCLQDVHWSAGLIGYFPTYFLGNLYAAQIYAQAQEELGTTFQGGNFSDLREWLERRVFQHGKRYRTDELVEVVSGKPPSHQPLIDYLQRKYGEIYGI